ncbi:hypothetical protein BV25DRAFT_1769636, partial [Artomyces pyxidatus]
NGLYRVMQDGPVFADQDEEEVLAAIDVLTVMELHRRMGHQSIRTTRALVEKGYTTGIKLDPASEPATCTSCLYGKATRLSIPKEREGGRANAFGDETHSDVWGPARVPTLRG